MATAKTKPRPRGASAARRPTKGKKKSYGWVWGALAAAAVVGVLFLVFRSSGGASGTGYQVGSPGIGAQAPTFSLPASNGQTIDLASLRGKSVLLYFQEGVGCEPCWTQMKDLEAASSSVKAAGVDEIISITTQPVSLLSQKARDEGVHMPVLADTSLQVSKTYSANQYGMMGSSMDGHTFVLVGPDGKIQWRADYGGAPKYTMYVPVKKLLAALEAGRRST